MKNKLVLAVTGGGSEVISQLLKYGGASSWFLEGIVPYNQKSLDSFLGFTPEKYASLDTAKQMAMKAFQRALELGASAEDAIGLGCSASLAQARDTIEREGRKHTAHIVVQLGLNKMVKCSYQFLEKRYREAEERTVSDLMHNLLMNLMGVKDHINHFIGLSKEEISLSKVELITDEYSMGDILLMDYSPNFRLANGSNINDQNINVFPGSFNPIHDGHLAIIEDVFKNTGKKVFIEISSSNVDKPNIGIDDVNHRINTIRRYGNNHIEDIVISRLPKFVYKSYAYPKGTNFIVGGDTYNRMFDNKYGDVTQLIIALQSNNNTVTVYNREGVKLLNNTYPNIFKIQKMLTPDISSSKIRKGE